MCAQIIDGRKIADEVMMEVELSTGELKRTRSITPGLAFILVGENPASQVYVRSKGRACEKMGFHSVTEKLPQETSQEQLLQLIRRFNQDRSIHGILIQLPLPRHIDEAKILHAIDFEKDVDGFHPVNVGKLVLGEPGFRPCTPAGIQELLLRSGHDPAGKHVVVVGRSNIVGKPVANLLLQKQKGANAVVTIAHTGAGEIVPYVRQADILVAAIGRPETIKGEMLKPGVVVIDVGINRIADTSSTTGYRLVGDVHFESSARVARAITPVPGGVGPMTIAMLMKNTLDAARGIYHS